MSPVRSSRLGEGTLSVNPRGRREAAVWWLSVTIAVLAASAWLRAPSVQYLALGGAATVAAIAVTVRRESRSFWMWGTTVALASAHLVAIPAQVDLRRIDADWTGWQQVAR